MYHPFRNSVPCVLRLGPSHSMHIFSRCQPFFKVKVRPIAEPFYLPVLSPWSPSVTYFVLCQSALSSKINQSHKLCWAPSNDSSKQWLTLHQSLLRSLVGNTYPPFAVQQKKNPNSITELGNKILKCIMGSYQSVTFRTWSVYCLSEGVYVSTAVGHKDHQFW